MTPMNSFWGRCATALSFATLLLTLPAQAAPSEPHVSNELIVELDFPSVRSPKGQEIRGKLSSAVRKLAKSYNLKLVGFKFLHPNLVRTLEREQLTEKDYFAARSLKTSGRLSQKLILQVRSNPSQKLAELKQAPERVAGVRVKRAALNTLNVTSGTLHDHLDNEHLSRRAVSIDGGGGHPYTCYSAPSHFAPRDPNYQAGNQWGVEALNIERAWCYTQGSPNTVIAVIDTGVDYTHEDLALNIWSNAAEITDNGIDDDGNGYIDDTRGFDFVNTYSSSCAIEEDCRDYDNDPMDKQSHGTHVAGIAAARANNGVGITGVCPRCRIMPLRAGYLRSDGYGSLPSSSIAQALLYAALNGADVINMSFTGSSAYIYQDELELAANTGAILIGAAGNNNSDSPLYPASLDEVIAVTALDTSFNRAWFSNYGLWTEITAPGESILSTIPGNLYSYWNGTSMAAPLVAGVAGLLKSRLPQASAEDIRKRLRMGANTAALSSETEFVGYGLVDAMRAFHAQSPQQAYAEISSIEETGDSLEVFGSSTGSSYLLEVTSGSYYGSDWQAVSAGTQAVQTLLGTTSTSSSPLRFRLTTTLENGAVLTNYDTEQQ